MTLLLSAIIGCWYAYQQNKSAKRHLRRMAKDMEGLFLQAKILLSHIQNRKKCLIVYVIFGIFRLAKGRSRSNRNAKGN